jgi:hypothetical protein
MALAAGFGVGFLWSGFGRRGTVSYFTLQCAACGKTQAMEGPAPQFGVHIMDACDVAGWGYLTDYRLVIVVCDDECGEAMLTKKGQLRRRKPVGFVKEKRAA